MTGHPTPLRPARTLPAFPVEVLPAPMAAIVRATATATQTDSGMAGTVAVTALAVAAGGRAEVELRAGWREPVNLFTATVAAPGERKSAVQAQLFAPLRRAEAELVEEAAPGVHAAETELRVARRVAEKAEQDAGRTAAGQREKATADAITAAEAAEAITVPVLPRLLAGDVTPEAIAGLLSEQGGRIAIVTAEAGLFDTLAGRYSGGIANLDVVLSGHAGDPVRVDRRGRPPEYVPRPALTIGIMAQPQVLQTIGRNPVMSGRGLLARFLYAVPPSRVGRRLVGATPVSTAVEGDWETLLGGLALTLHGWTDPAVLVLDDEARAVQLDHEQVIEDRLDRDGDLYPIVEWAAKLAGATARLAGLLHLAANPSGGWRRPISADTYHAAVVLSDYYVGHALAAFDLLGADHGTDQATEVLDHLRRRHAETFTIRSLFSEVARTRFAKVEDLAVAVQVLEDHGWVARIATEPVSGPGRRPSPGFTVHPDTWSAISAVSAESLGCRTAGASAQSAVSAQSDSADYADIADDFGTHGSRDAA